MSDQALKTMPYSTIRGINLPKTHFLAPMKMSVYRCIHIYEACICIDILTI